MRIKDLTKEQWLKRCETVYEWSKSHHINLDLLHNTVDSVLRLEGGQISYWVDFLESESKRTENFASHKTLVNDHDLYNLVYLTSILCHHCQQCAEDKNAWHTRPGFCEHKKQPWAEN